jgi:hypothetical protein
VLSRPLSPNSILGVKYLTGLLILLGWFALFNLIIRVDLKILALPIGIGMEWLWLLLIMIFSSSFLSGIVARGLERFFIICLILTFCAVNAYFILNLTTDLIKANYFWLDVPPKLAEFTTTIVPCYLLLLSLPGPMIGAYWHLRSQVSLWKFKPFYFYLGAWLLTWLLLMGAYHLFSPPLWCDKPIEYADWHEQAGILLAGPLDGKPDLHQAVKAYFLQIAHLNQQPNTIHIGLNISHPRFSPDGRTAVFSENGRLKLLELSKRKITDLGRGDFASWSHHSDQLIFAQVIGPRGLSRIYRLDLKRNSISPLIGTPFNVTDLVWDSEQNKLYLIGWANDLKCFDLKTNQMRTLSFPESDKPVIYFNIIPPSLVMDSENHLLFIAQSFNNHLQIFTVDTISDQVALNEEKIDLRVGSQEPTIINQNATALLWPRIDGSYVYQITYFQIGLLHQASPEREENK